MKIADDQANGSGHLGRQRVYASERALAGWLNPGLIAQLDPAGEGANFSATPFMQ